MILPFLLSCPVDSRFRGNDGNVNLGWQEVEVFELAVDYRFRVYLEPAVQQGGVGHPEVVVEVEVALKLHVRLDGRVVAIETAVHLSADHERSSARTVVGAGAVVLDATSKLGEDEDGDVVLTPMLAEVVVEVADSARHFVPELGMADYLTGVGVEAAVLGVEDAGAEVCEQHLGDTLETLGYRVGGVFH